VEGPPGAGLCSADALAFPGFARCATRWKPLTTGSIYARWRGKPWPDAEGPHGRAPSKVWHTLRDGQLQSAHPSAEKSAAWILLRSTPGLVCLRASSEAAALWVEYGWTGGNHGQAPYLFTDGPSMRARRSAGLLVHPPGQSFAELSWRPGS